jgi:hypothetical protein
MINLKVEEYLSIVNEEKTKRGLDSYVPLYPMLRVVDGKLFVAVMLTGETDNVWDMDSNIKAKYWVLIDPNTNEIIEFNKADEVDFVIGEMVIKNNTEKQKKISKYTVMKTLEYKNYLLNDIKNEQLPLQKKLSDALNNEFEIDGEKVNINEYIISNLEDEIKTNVDELVNLLVQSKYSNITFYYDQLFSDILNKYKESNVIDTNKIKLCIEIMNNYYDGVIAIDNMFNI